MLFWKINNLYLSVLTADLLAFLSGTAFSWSSPIILKLTRDEITPFGRNITISEATWISSLVGLGAAFGSFPFAYMANKCGKKHTLLTLGVPFIISYLLLSFGRRVEHFYIARILIGIAVGGVFALIPNYTSEIAEKRNRGIIATIMSISVCSGTLFSYCFGPYLDIMIFNLILAIMAVIFIISFYIFGKEPPQFYLRKGNRVAARKSLEGFRAFKQSDKVDIEMKEIEGNVSDDTKEFSMKLLKTKGFGRAFIITLGLILIQQTSGINLILFYSQTIFEKSGANFSANICSIIVGSVQFFSSFTTPFIIDSLGRKVTLIISSIGIIMSLVPLGMYFYLKGHEKDMQSVSFLPILTLTLFIFSYNCGVGPLPWVMMGELFPTKINIVASSVVSSINWSLSFLMTKYWDFFLHTFGLAQSFWVFAGCSALGILFQKLYVIETKGKSLEEIQDILNGK